jgi:hypothetical protein
MYNCGFITIDIKHELLPKPMNYKITLAAFIFILSLGITDAIAQRSNSSPKFRNAYKRKFRPSWSVFASPGIVVMNSDNTNDSDQIDEVGIIKNNGVGPTLSIGALYQFSRDFGIQGSLGYVNFSGSEDAVLTPKNPEVSFKSGGVEATTSLVYNLTNTYVGSRYRSSRNLRLVVPYVKVGIGVLAYKASASIESIGEELPEGKDYPSLTLIAPIGGGLKFQYSKQLSIAPELNVYLTTSDFLDNIENGVVSIYGTGSNDAYLSATVKIMYNITAHRRSPFKIRRR